MAVGRVPKRDGCSLIVFVVCVAQKRNRDTRPMEAEHRNKEVLYVEESWMPQLR